LQAQENLVRFERTILPHLDAAYNLARWLTRNERDAEDVAQESFLRAFQYFGGFRGGDGRVWLLKIVRNTCFSWLRRNRSAELSESLEPESCASPGGPLNPEEDVWRGVQRQWLLQALEELPVEFREVAILSDLEGLSYREIAEVVEVSLGTVMSRLSRARNRLRKTLTERLSKER